MRAFFHPLLALIASATDRELARYVRYLKEENRILRDRIPGESHTRLHERARLLKFEKPLERAIEELITIVTPGTFRRWVREEGRGQELLLLDVDTPRWSFSWQPAENRVIARPSRLGVASPGVLRQPIERAVIVANYEEMTGMFSCGKEQLGGKEVDSMTIYFPTDPMEDHRSPIHKFDHVLQRKEPGTQFRARKYWFDTKTGLRLKRRCGCRPAKWEQDADFPLLENVSQQLFKYEVPRDASLEVVDPELGRPIFSDNDTERD